MVSDSGLHRWSDAQALMYTAEVVTGKAQAALWLSSFFEKAFVNRSEAPDCYANREILARDKASAYVAWVRATIPYFHYRF